MSQNSETTAEKTSKPLGLGWSGDSFIRNTFTHTGGVSRIIQILWENKETGVSQEDLVSNGTISDADVLKCEYLGLIVSANGVERLDDRLEEYLGEVLIGIDSFEAGRYSEAFGEAKRLTRDFSQAEDADTRDALMKSIRKVMRQTRNRLERGIESLRSSVDLDYRASANLELKIFKLNHHKDTAQRINESLEAWHTFLSDNQFFRATTDREVQQHWKSFGLLSDKVRQGLLGVCHTIQMYLNQAMRDYKRARKLIHLNALINRQEHKTRSNIEEVAATCMGPLFSGTGSVLTAFAPTIIDLEPQVVEEALAGKFASKSRNVERIIKLNPRRHEELEDRIDWEEIRQAFQSQEHDLFRFLRDHVKINGQPPGDRDLITGYITIIQRAPELWKIHSDFETENGWQFAVINPTGRNE